MTNPLSPSCLHSLPLEDSVLELWIEKGPGETSRLLLQSKSSSYLCFVFQRGFDWTLDSLPVSPCEISL